MTTERQKKPDAGGSRSGIRDATPLARRMAARMSLELNGLTGSGIEGRITRDDVRALILQERTSTDPGAETESIISEKTVSPKGPSKEIREAPIKQGYDLQPLDHIRHISGEKLSVTKREISHFYLSADCEMDSLLGFRKELGSCENAGFSINDLILYTVARSLKKHPAANASWSREGIRIHRYVNLAIAVSTPRGQLTPVLRNAETKGIEAISFEMKRLRETTLAGKLDVEELRGGTFTVSNLGMYGIKQAIATINPPQACLLAVGNVEKKPVSREGELLLAPMMNFSLSYDHRVLDGAEASRFLACLKLYLEDPLQMLV